MEKRDDIFLILMVVAVYTVQCCASTVYAMALCPSLCVSDNPSQASVLSRQLVIVHTVAHYSPRTL